MIEKINLVFLRNRIPAHTDRFDGSEGTESDLESLLSNLEVDTSDIDSTHQHNCLG